MKEILNCIKEHKLRHTVGILSIKRWQLHELLSKHPSTLYWIELDFYQKHQEL